MRQERARGVKSTRQEGAFVASSQTLASASFIADSGGAFMPGIAVIIPCLNEVQHLPATLKALSAASDAAIPPLEVIVVDGGSEDGSVAVAECHPCKVIVSQRRQRAHQLNLGAHAALENGADVLWFVHADTSVPASAAAVVRAAMADHRVLGGGFCRRFDSSSVYLRWTSWVADLRGQLWRIFYGDQAMFVRGSAFETLNGFDEALDIAEDLDFSLRLRELGKIVALKPAVISSARRFEKLGPRKQIRLDRACVENLMRKGGWRYWRRGQRR